MICKRYKKQKWIADSDLICNHLRANKNCYGYFSQIEYDLSIPYRTLSYACSNTRKIPLKFIQPLKEYLKL